MQVYSKKIVQFIDEINRFIKDVLTHEVGLKVSGNRFFDKRKAYSYPIKVVIYNNKSMLGYFSPDFFELGFHELLMHTNKEKLQSIVRHEIAHYLTFMNNGSFILPHGAEFKATCQNLGWNEDVYKATTCLDDGAIQTNLGESGVLRKVQKLMALSSSSNQNEAEQAMIKSQQLLLKHNIDAKYMDGVEEEKVFLKRILKQKKENAKMRSIARILETFFVNIVYFRSGGYIYLEIVGSEVNIEIAEYVALFLESELEKIWNQTRREYENLKGMIAKNSFFMGIAKGYCNKIQSLKREYDPDVTQALMVIEKKLVDAKAMVYPRLSTIKSSASHCQFSSSLGEQVGRNLQIKPAIPKSPSIFGSLLTFIK
jgi:hypothetical protein